MRTTLVIASMLVASIASALEYPPQLENLWLGLYDKRLELHESDFYLAIRRQLEASAVSEWRLASTIASQHLIEKTSKHPSGLQNPKGPPRLFALGADVPDFGIVGDLVWECRYYAFNSTQLNEGLVAIIWINARNKAPKMVFP